MTYLEGKPNDTHLGLYQVINQLCQWLKIGDFTTFHSLTLMYTLNLTSVLLLLK